MILARTNWKKLFLLFYGAPLGLLLIALLFHGGRISEIFVLDNFLEARPFVGSAIAGRVAALVWVVWTTLELVKNIASKGRYLEIIDGSLVRLGHCVLTPKQLQESDAKLENRRLSQKLVLVFGGVTKTIFLSYAKFDEERILKALDRTRNPLTEV